MDFEKEEEDWPEDDFERLQAESLKQRQWVLDDGAVELAQQTIKPLSARGEGFSLHAATWVHANDRQGLERLVRYAARGPLAQRRLCREEEGSYRYETKTGKSLRLTAAQLVKRLLALLPPPRVHLTSFHGILAPNANQRHLVVQPAAAPRPARL